MEIEWIGGCQSRSSAVIAGASWPSEEEEGHDAHPVALMQGFFYLSIKVQYSSM